MRQALEIRYALDFRAGRVRYQLKAGVIGQILSYWANVHKIALKETLELARLDNPGRALMTLGLIAVPAFVLYQITQSAETWLRVVATIGAMSVIALLIYGWKLSSIPPRLARSLADEGAVREAENEKLINQLRLDLADARKPKVPARDYDGVYQLGQKVGKAINPQKLISAGEVRFATLEVTAEFNRKEPFEYQDFELELALWTGEGHVRMPGMEARTFNNVVAKITKRLSPA